MLTGTPLQNDLNELRNLLLLLVPQIFSDNHAQLLPEVTPHAASCLPLCLDMMLDRPINQGDVVTWDTSILKV